ncbi:MAG: ABC transporter permease [Bacteroidales bacterium]|nr:ABC transporter permease [Bacteroidales bacterium]
MRFPLFIARRYLFAKKSHHIINTISMISAVGIAIGTAALIIVLSVYNGFGRVVEQMYRQVDADLRIESSHSKTFTYDPDQATLWAELAEDERVAAICPILEEHVFVRYDGQQTVAVAKGVDRTYETRTQLVGQLVEGDFELYHGEIPQAVVGRGIARKLGIMVRFLDPLELYYPDPNRSVSLMNPGASLRNESFFVVGKVALEQQFDHTYIFVPLQQLQELVAKPHNAVSSLEIHLQPGVDIPAFQKEYAQRLGEAYRLLDRYQQNETVYQMMTYEKVAIYLIFFFIILIVACNIFGSLAMLILEKKDDICTFQALGASEKTIRQIFLGEGILITGIGTLVGLVLGLILSWIQQAFGIIQMPGNFLVQAYPVEVHLWDICLVSVGVFLISSLLAALPIYGKRLT